MSLELQQLADALGLSFDGAADLEIRGVASPAKAASGDLCFLRHESYLADIAASRCSAVILPPALADRVGARARLYSDNPQFDFARAISALGLERQPGESGVHPSAQVSTGARLGAGVDVGAMAFVGDDVEIGAGSSIGAGCVIESSVRIGEQCRLHPRVTLAQGVKIGNRCNLHPGAVIGADGFGLAFGDDRWHRIPQIGGVDIGDDVDIGANTTIDRGALDDTVIEEGCKLDNQIQVGHNVRIGAHTAIAGCVGIAGSAVIGRYCKISGAAVVLGHLEIADHVTVTAMSLVTKDIRRPGVYSSGTPLMDKRRWLRANARYRSLEDLARRVARLEKGET